MQQNNMFPANSIRARKSMLAKRSPCCVICDFAGWQAVTRKHRRIGTSGAVQLIYEFTPIRRLIALGDPSQPPQDFPRANPGRCRGRQTSVPVESDLKLKGDCQWPPSAGWLASGQPDTSTLVAGHHPPLYRPARRRIHRRTGVNHHAAGSAAAREKRHFTLGSK